MKQTKKYIITMAALLLSVTIWAQGKFTYIYQLNGASSTAAAAGTISGGISENGTATLTLTPAQGNYINADYITVVKTLSGGKFMGILFCSQMRSAQDSGQHLV